MRRIISISMCLSVALSSLLAVSGCQKMESESQFTLSAKAEPLRKVSMDSDYTLHWDKRVGSEKIWVVARDKDAGSSFEIVSVNGESAVFGLSKKGTVLEGKYASALDFQAVYPYTNGIDGWQQSLTFDSRLNAFVCDIADRQMILDGDNMDKSNLFMLASETRASASDPSPVLNFRNAVSLLSFNVTSADITKLVVSVTCDLPQNAVANYASYYQRRDMIAGKVYYYYPVNWPNKVGIEFGAYLEADRAGCGHVSSFISNQIEVTREGGKAFEVGKTYYIPVWPGVKNDFTATAYHSNGTTGTVKSRPGEFTCVRSMVHDLKSFE